MNKQMRLVLSLGKYRVTKIIPGALGCKFTLELPGSVTLTADAPIPVDVRLGDLLTLYTEVLSAPALPTPE